MISFCIDALWCFALLTAIGLGPALWCLNHTARFEAALCLAPALGLAFFACLGTYLVLADIPVGAWIGPFSATTATIGIFLALWHFRQDIHNATPWIGLHKAPFFGLLILIILLFMPPLLGGVDFIAFRGNADDALAYATLSQYLANAVYHAPLQLDMHALEGLNPLSSHAVDMLHMHWSTSILLAGFSHLANRSYIEFEPFLGLIFMLSAFGPAYLLSRSSCVPPLAATVSALVVCVGFWAQLVLDLQAMSHLNAIPLVLAASCVFVHLEAASQPVVTPSRGLLGLLCASIALTCIELTPILAVGLVVYILIRFVNRDMTLHQVGTHRLSFMILLLLFLPQISYFWTFFTNQATHTLAMIQATNETIPWYHFYFHFLNERSIASLWGIAGLEPPQSVPFLQVIIQILSALFAAILSLCSITLSFLFLKDTAYRKENPAILFLLCMAAGGLLYAAILFIFNFPWSAAKGLSFIAPFCILTPTALVACRMHDNFESKFIDMSALLVTSWLVCACIPGLVRPVHALLGTESEHAPGHHMLYRAQSLDLTPIHIALTHAHQRLDRHPRVAVSAIDPWTQNYLILAISSEATPSVLSHDISDPDAQPLDFVLLDTSRVTNSDALASYFVAQSGNFALLKLRPEQTHQLAVLSLDFTSKKVFFDKTQPGRLWIRAGNIPVSITSATTGVVTLSLLIQKGPASSGLTRAPFFIELPNEVPREFDILEKEKITLTIPVKQGTNTIFLHSACTETLESDVTFALENLTLSAFVKQKENESE